MVLVRHLAYDLKAGLVTIKRDNFSAPQGGIFLGGTEQVYIQNAKHISGIKIVEKYSIKEAYLWKQKVKK
jgi:hypothetical protein